MSQQYVVDFGDVPWKASQTQGITFKCQVLLSGTDGGPEAIRFRFDRCPSVYAHMHLTSQFQFLLQGTMDFPKHSTVLRPLAVHYTDHNFPYGPFAVGTDHDVLVLHPKRGGLMTMADRSARKQINLGGRELTGMEKDADWLEVPGYQGARCKILIPRALGPEVVLLEWPPNTPVSLGAPTYGRYEVVLKGSFSLEDRCLNALAMRYVQGDDLAVPLKSGPDGGSLAFLSFDQDALEGGLTGDGLALAAEEALARAI